MAKTKAHTRYRNSDGKVIPGVTTILGILNKPALVAWANKLGLQGIDSSKYRDAMGDIGTLAHKLILANLKGEELDTSEYSNEQIGKAENCFLSYLEWQKNKTLEPIVVEKPLVSELLHYGGTLDYYGYIDNSLVLLDYKTGGIYKEAIIQTCAYRELLIENGYEPAEKIIILSIPRNENETFKEIAFTNFDTGWEMFKHLREIYDLQKLIKV